MTPPDTAAQRPPHGHPAPYTVRAQFACGHYRALTAKEAHEEFTQIGVDCFCPVCGKKRQVTRREII